MLPLLVRNVLAQFGGTNLYQQTLHRTFSPGFLSPGDIAFQMVGGTAGHAIIVARDTAKAIHSVSPDGVCWCPGLPMDLRIYRYAGIRTTLDPIGQRAALLAEDWIGQVRYADGDGLPFRAVGAALGSSKFGTGASERLKKYQSRRELWYGEEVSVSRPKNAICSELCILAYQLSTDERSSDFIRLDAKFATPEVLRMYFEDRANGWRLRYSSE